MAFASSWKHTVPPTQSASISNSPATGSKQQAAEELLAAYRSVPHVKGKLPTLADLPHTVFCMNPKNDKEGRIAYVHPDKPEYPISYCFLRADTSAMADIKEKHNAYAAIPRSYPTGGAPFERMPLEIMRRITEELWDNKGLWDDNADVKHLSQVSKTMCNKLLDVHKVKEISKRWEELPSHPAEQVAREVNGIVEYTRSDQPVKLVGASLLVAFNLYLKAIVGMTGNDQTYILIDRRSVIDNSIGIIEAMRDEPNQAKALTGLHQHPIPEFMRSFTGNEGFDRAKKLLGIVAKMKSNDAKAAGIAALGNLLRMSGFRERKNILYAALLLELTANLKAGPEAQEKICQAFQHVREHLARYCAHHYDASHGSYPLFHNELVDTEENQEADLDTGRQLDAYLETHDVALRSVAGPMPLWHNG